MTDKLNPEEIQKCVRLKDHILEECKKFSKEHDIDGFMQHITIISIGEALKDTLGDPFATKTRGTTDVH